MAQRCGPLFLWDDVSADGIPIGPKMTAQKALDDWQQSQDDFTDDFDE